MQETQVQSLGGEDPLEEEMATHSSMSCLGNAMDRGAWWATVHGVAKSLTRLSRSCCSLFSAQAFPQPEVMFLRTGKPEPAQGVKMARFSPCVLGCYVVKHSSLYSSLLRSDPLRSAGSQLLPPPPPPPRDPPPAAPVAAPGTSACSKHDLCLPPPT